MQFLNSFICILDINFTDPVKLKNNKGIIADDLRIMGKIFQEEIIGKFFSIIGSSLTLKPTETCRTAMARFRPGTTFTGPTWRSHLGGDSDGFIIVYFCHLATGRCIQISL